MVTLNLKLYAAPLALLMLTAPLAAPKANHFYYFWGIPELQNWGS